MTIKGVAQELGVSTMTVYRRLKQNGVSVDELRDADTGELTAAGASIIAAMFRHNSVDGVEHATEQTATEVAQRDGAACDSGEVGPDGGGMPSAAVLAARLEGAQALIAQLEAERDSLRDQLRQLNDALEREQRDRAAERRLLLPGGDDDVQQEPRRRGWWPWRRR